MARSHSHGQGDITKSCVQLSISCSTSRAGGQIPNGCWAGMDLAVGDGR